MKKWLLLLLVVVVVIAAVWLVRSPYWLRFTFGVSDTLRDRGLATPDTVTRIDNERYGADPMQVFDVYYPKGTESPLPTIVSIHGGGYTYGTKEVYQYYCMSLAEHGFTVVNFSYRLAPGSRYPAPLEDTNALMTAICANAAAYRIDTGCIFFVGDSAGGQLNAQYCTAVSNPAYAEYLGLTIPDFTLRGTALNCGVYRPEDLTSITWYFADEADAQQLDLTPYITSAYPPSFVMSATGDSCLPYAEPFCRLLQDRGVYAELHIYGDSSEKPPHVFHVNIKTDVATLCNDEECAFFRACLDGTLESRA